MACAICGHVARFLGPHVLREHGIKPRDYAREHGPLMPEHVQEAHRAESVARLNDLPEDERAAREVVALVWSLDAAGRAWALTQIRKRLGQQERRASGRRLGARTTTTGDKGRGRGGETPCTTPAPSTS
ncbi:MAG TPA: hypothetical protein PLD23_10425 [Armatimonadota bacterium]|nr:hypothetical protein [Armatimonadota bacterium]